MKKIPDKWENYSAIGNLIRGTRFIAFKVPLSGVGNFDNLLDTNYTSHIPPDVGPFTPSMLVREVQMKGHRLGLVIDLTNTNKYYHENLIKEHGIRYKKIYTEGHVVPKIKVIRQFFEAVDNFINENNENSDLVGVHCTHGINRTGYLICRYMINKLGCSPEDSIRAFNEGRGHPIERQNYIDDLHDSNKKEQYENDEDGEEEEEQSYHAYAGERFHWGHNDRYDNQHRYGNQHHYGNDYSIAHNLLSLYANSDGNQNDNKPGYRYGNDYHSNNYCTDNNYFHHGNDDLPAQRNMTSNKDLDGFMGWTGFSSKSSNNHPYPHPVSDNVDNDNSHNDNNNAPYNETYNEDNNNNNNMGSDINSNKNNVNDSVGNISNAFNDINQSKYVIDVRRRYQNVNNKHSYDNNYDRYNNKYNNSNNFNRYKINNNYNNYYYNNNYHQNYNRYHYNRLKSADSNASHSKYNEHLKPDTDNVNSEGNNNDNNNSNNNNNNNSNDDNNNSNNNNYNNNNASDICKTNDDDINISKNHNTTKELFNDEGECIDSLNVIGKDQCKNDGDDVDNVVVFDVVNKDQLSSCS